MMCRKVFWFLVQKYLTILGAETSPVNIRVGRLGFERSRKDIDSRLPGNKFVRIHKPYIEALDKIAAIDNNVVVLKSCSTTDQFELQGEFSCEDEGEANDVNWFTMNDEQ